MLRSATTLLFGRTTRLRLRLLHRQAPPIWFTTDPHIEVRRWITFDDSAKELKKEFNLPVGQKITRRERNDLLVKTLLDLGDSKDSIYGALDAWVAWEQNFPIAALKHILLTLEKEHQWHRVVQVIKWMLSKGQGNTTGTYQQLIRALDMDHRAEEAHNFWMKKIGNDLHSVPWQACHLMISVYHRNNMLDRLVKLFKGLEAFDRKPPDRLIVQKVADAYELLGLEDDKERLLEKYVDLLNKPPKDSNKQSKRLKSKKKHKPSGSKSSLANAIEA